jgi:ribosomal protein S18 acetylase RimI-like enzyme
MAPHVALRPLTDEEYADFAERQVAEYGLQNVNAGEWRPEDAPARAREVLADLLADRLRGAGHAFLKGVTADGMGVGWLWVAPAPGFLGPDRERTRWLSQITVDEALRGRGFGRALLEALHARLSAEGVEELWLRVFDWNTAARCLYSALGYEVVREFTTDAHMRKRLGGSGLVTKARL